MTRRFDWSEQITILRALQKGRCGACDRETHALKLDHDHQTGMTRGLLCNACNLGEGSGDRANGVAEYLAAPPAADFQWEFQDHFGVWELDRMAAMRGYEAIQRQGEADRSAAIDARMTAEHGDDWKTKALDRMFGTLKKNP